MRRRALSVALVSLLMVADVSARSRRRPQAQQPQGAAGKPLVKQEDGQQAQQPATDYDYTPEYYDEYDEFDEQSK